MSRVEHIGDATLYLGSMEDILPTLTRADACLTDPPYGINEDGGKFRGRTGQNIKVLPKMGWDAMRPPARSFELLLQCADEHIIWGGNYFADLLPPSKGWLYWQKLMGGDFSDGELAWTSRDKALREFTCCPKGKGGLHPTQKPVEVMQWCLALLPNARTIIDPFAGSGTTGVACANLGRSFIGIEREPSYFEIACRRVEEAYRQPQLFAEPVVKPVQAAFDLGAV